MEQIIRLIDVNVDGCGTNVETYIQVKGEKKLTDDIVNEIKTTIETYKRENAYEYQTYEIIAVACDYLETKGYTCCSMVPSYDIEF